MKNNYLDAAVQAAIRDDLGIIDQLWTGWRLKHGQLFDPEHSNTQGWTPSQVRTLMYLHELVRAQRGEIEKSKDQLQRLETLIGQHGPEETSAKIRRSPKLREEFPQLATASRPETSPERRTRQLSTLARPAQNETPERRSDRDRRLSWRGQAPASGRIDPALVRADPARHKRSF